jgi:hypothetical protein
VKKTVLAFCIVIAVLAAAYADIIYFKDGTVREGKITRETDDSVSLLMIQGASEAELTFPTAEIERVERRETITVKYLKLREATPADDPAALKKLSEWCAKNSLPLLAKYQEKKARELFLKEYITQYPDALCNACDGRGEIECAACGAKGHIEIPCGKCDNSGRIECPGCLGTGQMACPRCGGAGQIIQKKTIYVDGKPEVVLKAVTCPRCRGKKYLDCPKCRDGAINCPDCRGRGYTREKCSVCGGRKTLKCEKCDGSGFNKQHADDFEREFRNLGKSVEVAQTPVVEKNDKPDGTEPVPVRDPVVKPGPSRPEAPAYISCPACGGKGKFPCPACRGGWIDIGGTRLQCKVCGGKGELSCRRCNGTGKIKK